MRQTAQGSAGNLSGADVGIVGGGPAGSTLAALLACQGVDVVLLERDRFPRDKLCGEFLSGEVERVLQESGCLDTFHAAAPARISRAVFTAPGGVELGIRLPVESFGISRRRLDALLLRHAGAAGARVLEATGVDAVAPAASAGAHGAEPGAAVVHARSRGLPAGPGLECSFRLVALAHGRRSSLDRQLERDFLRHSSPYVGLKLHHYPQSSAQGKRLSEELSGAVEIHTFAGGYCGICFVEEGLVNVCMLVEERWLKRLATPKWPQICEAISRCQPSFARRYEALDPSGEVVRAVAQVCFSEKERHRDGLLFLGDAAAMIAPLCGDGQAMAMEAAALLAPLIAHGLRSPTDLRQLPRRWERAWRGRFRARLWWGRALQRLLLGHRSASLGLRLARRTPALVNRLARATRGI